LAEPPKYIKPEFSLHGELEDSVKFFTVYKKGSLQRPSKRDAFSQTEKYA
jgi:hypothetical protein